MSLRLLGDASGGQALGLGHAGQFSAIELHLQPKTYFLKIYHYHNTISHLKINDNCLPTNILQKLVSVHISVIVSKF